jgi:3-hydroxyisobutyrate dehydrogenase-like beta-hydroxyacid dehydrogenase
MKIVGVVGLGDMGSGLAKNLLKHGFEVRGADLLSPTPRGIPRDGRAAW